MSESITIKYDGAAITVKPSTIGSAIQRDRILYALHGVSDTVTRYLFAQAASQSVIEGDLGWTPPLSGDTSQAIQASFEEWMNLPGELGDAWLTAISRVNAPSAPPEHQPEVDTDADPE